MYLIPISPDDYHKEDVSQCRGRDRRVRSPDLRCLTRSASGRGDRDRQPDRPTIRLRGQVRRSDAERGRGQYCLSSARKARSSPVVGQVGPTLRIGESQVLFSTITVNQMRPDDSFAGPVASETDQIELVVAIEAFDGVVETAFGVLLGGDG